MDVQADDINQDGSITITLDGKKIKFVRESDLGAVKVQLKEREGELTKFQTDLANANTKYDGEHQELLKVRASHEELEKSAGESATYKQQVEDLTKQMAGLKETSGGLETRYTERLRTQLTEGFKVDAEKIKDKGLADLETIEQTLILTGYQPAPANYDGKGGGGGAPAGSLVGKSPLALATMGYEENTKKK